jgi:hypothetical protein
MEELEGASKGKALETGIGIAAGIIKTIKDKPLTDGVHIMLTGKE